MAYAITFPTQHFVLNGVPLSTPAWELLNLQVLLAGPAIRGSNVILPGASGTKARRRRATERSVTLELQIFGDRDPNGVAHTDPVLGLMLNIDALRQVTEPPTTNDSLVTATLIWKSITRDEPVQVVGFDVGGNVGTGSVAATIDLVIPTGAFS